MSDIRIVTVDNIEPPRGDLSFRIDFDATLGSPAHILEIAGDLGASLPGLHKP